MAVAQRKEEPVNSGFVIQSCKKCTSHNVKAYVDNRLYYVKCGDCNAQSPLNEVLAEAIFRWNTGKTIDTR